MNYYFQIGDYEYDLKDVTYEKNTEEEFKGLTCASIYTLTRSRKRINLTREEKLKQPREKNVFVAIIFGDTVGNFKDERGFTRIEERKIFESWDEHVSLPADKLAIKRAINSLER